MDIFNESYFITAKAKGFSERRLIFKHVIKNVMLPILTLISLAPVIFVTESLAVEFVYSLYGVGRILYDSMVSVTGFKYFSLASSALLQATFLILGTIVVIGQFFVDVLYRIFDPRLQTDGAGIKLNKEQASQKKNTHLSIRRLKLFLRRFWYGNSGKFGIIVIGFFLVTAILVPVLPINSEEQVIPPRLEPPSLLHPLGIDYSGRDVLARVVLASRVSVIEFVSTVVLALSVGCFVGLISGYYDRKWFAYLLDRITDLFLAVPLIVFVLLFPLEIPISGLR